MNYRKNEMKIEKRMKISTFESKDVQDSKQC